MENNPLTNYFRRPSIYIKLPSNGRFWPPDALVKNETGEYPVYPMTAVDEISYRTPDALFNGQAVVDVIQSCVPNIKNAWAMPGMDLDTILIAIRIASYSHEMDVETSCPKCSESANYSLDLRNVLDNLKTPDYTRTIELADLSISLKPLNYKQISDSNIIQFEEQKMLQVVSNSDVGEDEKVKLLSEAFKKVGQLTIRALRQSIESIQTPETTVSDPKFIDEFLKNCDRSVFDKIRDTVTRLKTSSELKPLHVKCSSCGHEYDQQFTLDMTNFFA